MLPTNFQLLTCFKGVTANHRARDCLVLENQPQVISGRFVYGLFDMVNLTGEKVDLYTMLPVSATHRHFFERSIVLKSQFKIDLREPKLMIN